MNATSVSFGRDSISLLRGCIPIMTDRQKSEALSWLKTHSSATVHSLSHFLSVSPEQARAALLDAVNVLGREQFRLIYCLHKTDDQAFSLISSENTMDVESEDMVLFAVQYKTVGRETVNQAEKMERCMGLEKALAAGSLVANQSSGIKPLNNKVRELLPHRKRKGPAQTEIPPPKIVNESGKVSGPPKVRAPALKSQSKLKATVQPKVEEQPRSPLSPKKSDPPSPTGEPTKPVTDCSQPHVTFSEDSEHVERPVKRRSTPHPSKHLKRSDDSINDILKKSNLYTVEEDDTEATPIVTLKRKLDETTEPIAKKTSARTESTPAETTATQVPTEGVKRVKVTKTKTFMDEKGYLVTKDVIEEEFVKVQTMPLKPVNEAPIPHKKGKQTELGSFFAKKT